MAHPKRHLIPFAAVIFAAAFNVLSAAIPQTGGPASSSTTTPTEPPPLRFRVVVAGNPSPMTGLHYDYKGKSVVIAPSDVSLSPIYEREKPGPIVFYRELPAIPPETKPRRVPVLTADFGTGALHLLVMKANLDGTVSASVIDDSWAAFPGQTVRVLSFSRRKVAAQVEGAGAELPPTQTHLFPYASSRLRIRCKVACLDEGGWKIQFNNSQAIIPGARVNILVSDSDPTPLDPLPDGINVLKMIDPLKPPI